jgi:proteasome lid subunit RPN8/RPN11
MSTTSIEVSYPAYSTVILHCAKYPASEVMGFLLGSVQSSKVVIEKSIPVQHHWNRLSPMVEVAASLVSLNTNSVLKRLNLLCIQTQAYAESQTTPLKLVGIYHAPSDVTSSTRPELSPTATKLAQSLEGKLGREAIVLQVRC